MTGSGQCIPCCLSHKRDGISTVNHEQVRKEQREQCPRHKKPAGFMRQKLNEDRIVTGRKRPRQIAKQLVISEQRSNLAAILRAGTACDIVIRLCLWFEHSSLSLEDDSHWRQYIIENRVLWQFFVEFAANGVDRSSCSGDRMNFALHGAKRFLISPIQAHVGPGLVCK